jgi:hypothetical protein
MTKLDDRISRIPLTSGGNVARVVRISKRISVKTGRFQDADSKCVPSGRTQETVFPREDGRHDLRVRSAVIELLTERVVTIAP